MNSACIPEILQNLISSIFLKSRTSTGSSVISHGLMDLEVGGSHDTGSAAGSDSECECEWPSYWRYPDLGSAFAPHVWRSLLRCHMLIRNHKVGRMPKSVSSLFHTV